LAFVVLGLVNARRNLGRSALAVASMAVAALVVTSLLSLSTSAHPGAMLPERFLLGGDVIITGLKLASGARDLDPAASLPDSWRLGRAPRDGAGIWAEIVPWIWQYGYLAPGGEGGAAGLFLTPEQVDGIIAGLAANPRVRAALPVAMIPVLEPADSSRADGRTGPVLGFLLGRDPALDRETFGRYLSEDLMAGGVYLDGSDLARAAVVDALRSQRGYSSVYPGMVLSCLVPSMSESPEGTPFFDYSAPKEAQFPVVGAIRTPTELQLVDDALVPTYWGTGAILVSDETLRLVAEESGLSRAPVTAVAVRARDLVNVKSFVAEIREAFPGLTVVSVAELVAATSGTGSIAPLLSEVTAGQVAGSLVPRAVPLDLDLVFAAIAFTIAALLVASNLLVLLTARKREIGVLRAIGARAADVAVMVVTEALVLTAAGCFLGYWPVRLLSTIALVSNRLSLGRIAALTLGHFGMVLGMGLGFAALFALLPAVATTRLTCTEALRNG